MTYFQRLELVLIPTFFLVSQILIFLFGLTMIGEEIWIFMGIPILFGSILSILVSFLLNHRKLIHEFDQLESFFRILVFGGGGAIIIVLLFQINGLLAGSLIFTVLSLVFSTLGGLMTISCLILLYRTRPKHASLE
ncbi:MAG: hypothetical protein ACFE8U_08375 [Candidatus Hermodarchaeota archaeon]